MYKVFIDNKVIIFVEKWKKAKKTLDFVLVDTAFPEQLDLLKCRDELPKELLLIVKSKDPVSTMKAVFSDFDFVEAAGGIVKRKNKFLFIERHDRWDIPKGKMEEGEYPESTAVREIEEECGITGPKITHFLGNTYHTYTYEKRPTLKKTWWYALSYDGPQELSPQTEESITQAVWFTKKQWSIVRENTYPSIGEVLEMYSGK